MMTNQSTSTTLTISFMTLLLTLVLLQGGTNGQPPPSYNEYSSGSSSSGGAESSRTEFHHNILEEQQQEQEHIKEYFQLELNPPETVNISNFRQWQETGWKIHDAQNRNIKVQVEIPEGMRQGKPGRYTIRYQAFVESFQNAPIGEAFRTALVQRQSHCSDGQHRCSSLSKCIENEDGSGYRCECKPGFRGLPDGKHCVNINECLERIHDCGAHAICTDTHGSWKCSCPHGYEQVGKDCLDVDECTRGSHQCGKNAICVNTVGSYRCECPTGFYRDGRDCVPINFCFVGGHNCHLHADCTPLPEGGFTCACHPGWRGDGIHSCEDIDECAEQLDNCPRDISTCENTKGSYKCNCHKGYKPVASPEERVCEDVNECAEGIDDCHQNADCINVPGSYHCVCHRGFHGDGFYCEGDQSPRFELVGSNPLVIKQYSEYSEAGLEFVDDQTNVAFQIDIPRQIEGVAKECGIWTVKYHAIFPDHTDFHPMDPKLKQPELAPRIMKERRVEVVPTNQCELPSSSPFAASCHPYAKCEHVPSLCDYRCLCPKGYAGDGRGPTGCVDKVPPVIPYSGPNPLEQISCVVCDRAIVDPDTCSQVIHSAYDPTPLGNIDVSGRLEFSCHSLPGVQNCSEHLYFASDFAGNNVTRSLTVCKRNEDIRSTLHEMKEIYDWQISLIKTICGVAFLALALLFLYEFGHCLAAMVRVFFSRFSTEPPLWDDFHEVYFIWERIFHPFARSQDISKSLRDQYNDQYQNEGYSNLNSSKDEDSEYEDLDSEDDDYDE